MGENVLIALITGLAAVIVGVLQVWKKISLNADNIQANADAIDKSDTSRGLINTLNSTVSAQTKQIDILRGIVDEQRLQLEDRDIKITDLTNRVSKLEQLTISQALIISNLEERAKSRRTPYKRNEAGEVVSHE